MKILLRGAGRLALFAVLIGAGSAARANQALSTPFVDVEVQNVPLGKAAAVHDARGWPLIVNNTGDKPLRVRVSSLLPRPAQLRPGFRPVPDAGWVTIRPESQVIAPHASAHCDVTVHVPANPVYASQPYQSMIAIQGRSFLQAGLSIEGGLLVRLRFTTAGLSPDKP